ncbi:MAG: GNAT family N-acetyltransferase [Acetobacteraceae bacterium]
MLAIEMASEPSEAVAVLIGELEGVLSAEYPAEQRHGLPLQAIFQPHIRFFLARLDGDPVGCGGVALFPGFAEVKRMYVRTRARGQGVAQALLVRIEEETRGAGLVVLRLETGTAQKAAMRLYEKTGFRPRDAFHPYAGMPLEAIAGSRFYEKRLVTEGALP